MELRRKIKILDETETGGALEIHTAKIEATENALARLSSDLDHKDLELARCEEIISKFERQLGQVRTVVQETAFRTELYLARGHIDIKRLRLSADKLQVCQTE